MGDSPTYCTIQIMIPKEATGSYMWLPMERYMLARMHCMQHMYLMR